MNPIVLLSFLGALLSCQPVPKNTIPQASTCMVFSCEARPLETDMSQAEITDAYLTALADGRENGYTPVVVFDSGLLEETIEDAHKKEDSAEAYREKLLHNDHSQGKEFLTQEFDYYTSIFGEEYLSLDPELVELFLSMPEMRMQETELPSPAMSDGDAYLLKVPTAKPYEVFAWLPFGGWNTCPRNEDLIAISKYWYETYGALPAVITSDCLMFYLEEPVTDATVLAELAKEQCAFCPDLLGMAEMFTYPLISYGSNLWNFWWD